MHSKTKTELNSFHMLLFDYVLGIIEITAAKVVVSCQCISETYSNLASYSVHVAQLLCQYHTLSDIYYKLLQALFLSTSINYLTESNNIVIGNREKHEAYVYYMYIT